MKRRIRVEQEAEDDICSAVEYYRDEAGEDVALRFVDAVDDGLRFLGDHEVGRRFDSGTHPKLRKLRIWPLKVFPYAVIFESNSEEVRVYSVPHTKRDLPEILKARLKDET